jgi:Queuine tRNA-ribosyltransferase
MIRHCCPDAVATPASTTPGATLRKAEAIRCSGCILLRVAILRLRPAPAALHQWHALTLAEDISRILRSPRAEACTRLGPAGVLPWVLPDLCWWLCRAYVHHLLEVRELVGDMLLHYHNVHHMLRFMGAVRGWLRDGCFPAEHARFQERVSALLGADGSPTRAAESPAGCEA